MWLNKYRPENFNELSFNKETNERIKGHKLVNTIFYGPEGSGKKTRIKMLLKDKFYVEIDLKNHKNKTEILNETVNGRFKIIILHNLKDEKTQKMLCNLMDKNARKCRFFICCEHLNLIENLVSRCFCIKVPSPVYNEISNYIDLISKKEKFIINENDKKELIKENDFNITKILLNLQVYSINKKIVLPEWKTYIKIIVNFIKSKENIISIRLVLYDLISKIDHFVILDSITKELLKNGNNTELIDVYCIYQTRMKNSKKYVYHLEAFIVKCTEFF